jgi:hypothetical protein
MGARGSQAAGRGTRLRLDAELVMNDLAAAVERIRVEVEGLVAANGA